MSRKAASPPPETPRNGSAPPTNGHSSTPGPDLPYSVKDLTDDQVKNAFREMNEFIHNRDWTRAKTFASLFDKRRNLEKECGYPTWGEETVDDYQKLYDREAVARRVVEVMPKECFQVFPDVYEEENIEITTPFEQSVVAFNKQIGGGADNHHVDQDGSYLKEKWYELDIKSGIGSFGILLFGLDDVTDPEDLRNPVQGWADDPDPETFIPAGRRVLFMRSFSAAHVDIKETENSPTSPRYGLPLLYTIDFAQGSYEVHWTRVLHVDSESGAPRMQPVLNRLLDLRKVYACSAEMYWLAAFMGIFFKVQDKALELSNGRPTLDVEEMRNQLENFFNSLQRYLQLTGLEPVPMYTNTLSDPQGQVQVLMEAICVEVGIPKRIFTGSERGELASSQDDEKWNERVKQRQNTHLTPKVIVPCINRLIKYGALKPPGKKGFRVEWPDMTAQTDMEHADIVFKTTQAMSGYMKAGVRQLIPEFEFLTIVLGLSEREATNIVAKALKVREEEQAKREADEKRVAKLGGKLPAIKVKLPEGQLENTDSDPDSSTTVRLVEAFLENLRQVQNANQLRAIQDRTIQAQEVTLQVENLTISPQVLAEAIRVEVGGAVNNFSASLALPEQAAPTVNNYIQVDPTPVEITNEIEVSPTPVEVTNNIQASPVMVENNLPAPVIENLNVDVTAKVEMPRPAKKKVVIEGPGGETYEGSIQEEKK